MNSLQVVESMSAVSTRMVAAAQANDWDLLAELERQLADLRRQLTLLEPTGSQAEPLSSEQRLHKVALIQRILADEQEIRSHVDPWMASTRRLLLSDTRARTMRAAYGAMMAR
jgi:flagellar protein FliT